MKNATTHCVLEIMYILESSALDHYCALSRLPFFDKLPEPGLYFLELRVHPKNSPMHSEFLLQLMLVCRRSDPGGRFSTASLENNVFNSHIKLICDNRIVNIQYPVTT